MIVALFVVLATITLGGAIAVALDRNVVRAAVWLLFTLLGVAGIYLLLGADFVGATQILVYVGGTLVLLVFGVMLTAQAPFMQLQSHWTDRLAAIVVAGLIGSIAVLVLWPGLPSGTAREGSLPGTAKLGEALLGVEDESQFPLTNLPIGAARNRPRTAYLLPFEVISVHLLVVLIAAAYLARPRLAPPPAPSQQAEEKP